MSRRRRSLMPFILAASLAVAGVGPVAAVDWPASDLLVVGEIVTGGTTGADEYVELYNAGSSTAPLADLELVYVSASGKSVTRKHSWSGGGVPAGGRVLLANENGGYAATADHTYSDGLSATGGSVVLRHAGGPVVDALSWGTAASGFVEGTAAAAPPAGSSLERRPGDGGGNGRDTNDNAADTRINDAPEAQGSGGPLPTPLPTPKLTPAPTPEPTSAPTPKPTPAPTPEPTAKATPAATPKPTPEPSAKPTSAPSPTMEPTLAPTPTPTPKPTPEQTSAPTPTPTPGMTPRPTPRSTEAPPVTPAPTAGPTQTPEASARPGAVLDIATARGSGVGSEVTVEGTVTADAGRILGEHTLVVQDASGGIPVRLPSAGLVGDIARGTIIRATGELAEPYGNLELRPDEASDFVILGSGGLPAPASLGSSGLNEGNEGVLATVTASVISVASYSSGAVSISIADTDGEGKVYAFAPIELDAGALERDQRVRAVGIVGQRASSSGAADGYRLWLRGADDLTVLTTAPPPTPSTPPGDDSGPTVPVPPRVRIAEAAEGDTVIIVGVVTSKAGLIDSEARRVTVQDRSGAILVRYPADTTPARVGSVIRAVGEVGTWFGARQLEAAKEPRRKRTGAVRVTNLRRPPVESDEWRLVRVAVRVTDIERSGDTWRAEAELPDGSTLPIVGLAGAGIDGELLEPGRAARVTGIVRRAHPSASDQRFAVAPRSRKDIRLGSLLLDEGDTDEGGQGQDDADGDGDRGLVAAADSSDPGVFAATFGSLDGLEGRLVRVGGRVETVADRRLTLHDGTARGTVRFAATVEQVEPGFYVGEVINTTGRVERRGARAVEVVVGSAADVRRVASLRSTRDEALDAAVDASPPDPRPDPAPASRPSEPDGSGAIIVLAGVGLLFLAAGGLSATTVAAIWLLRRRPVTVARPRSRPSHEPPTSPAG